MLLVAWPGAAAQAAGRCGNHPWCDTSLSPAKRADLLLDALTPAERSACRASTYRRST